MTEDHFNNLQEIVSKKFVIVGAGGIGNHAYRALLNLGVKNIEIYDFDDLDYHNLSRTLFRQSSVGNRKVGVMSDCYSTDPVDKKITKFQSVLVNEILKDPDNSTLLEAFSLYENLGVSARPYGRAVIYRIHREEVEKGKTIIVECTDSFMKPTDNEDEGGDHKSLVRWKLNYDNTNIVVTSNPYAKNESGSYKMDIESLSALGTGYTTTPSFLLTPSVLVDVWIQRMITHGVTTHKTEQFHNELTSLTKSLFKEVS